MEAKDTVKSPQEIAEVLGESEFHDLADLELAKAQAEISFKAGQESRQDEIDLRQAIINEKEVAIIDLKSVMELKKKAGIKEVVDCIREHGVGYALSEAQLKEWGIKGEQ